MIDRSHSSAARARFLLAVVAVVALMPVLASLSRTSNVDAADGATTFKVNGDPVQRLVPSSLDAPGIYVIGAKGLYRGDQSGSNWQRLTGDPPPGDLVASADGGDLMLAGSHQQCGRGGGATPLSRSTDGGASWQTVNGDSGLQPLAVWNKANLALAADCGGPQVSLDGGDSWTRIPQIELGREVTAFATIDGIKERKVLLGVTGEGGTSELYEVDLTKPDSITVSPQLKQYFATGALAGYKQERVLAGPDGVWLSIDQGQNWALRAKGLEKVVLSVDPLTEAIPSPEAKRGFGLNAIALNPTSSSRMIVGSINGAFATTNAGASWTPVAGIKGEVEAIVVGDLGNLVLVQTENGVFRVHPWS
jgi:hypothetical protein